MGFNKAKIKNRARMHEEQTAPLISFIFKKVTTVKTIGMCGAQIGLKCICNY